MASSQERLTTPHVVVLMGVQGSGKSATANSFIGEAQIFKSRCGSVACTKDCSEKAIDLGVPVVVVDTPGLTKIEDFEIIKTYTTRRGFQKISYVFVIRVGRYSSEELDLLQQVPVKYRAMLEGRTIILFTAAGELENTDNMQSKETLTQYLARSHQLGNFMKNYKGQFAIDNVYWDKQRRQAVLCDILRHKGFKGVIQPEPTKHKTLPEEGSEKLLGTNTVLTRRNVATQTKPCRVLPYDESTMDFVII